MAQSGTKFEKKKLESKDSVARFITTTSSVNSSLSSSSSTTTTSGNAVQLEPDDTNVPGGVMNIMSGYIFGEDKVSGHASQSTVPLVFTLSKIKAEQLARLRTLLTALVNGNPTDAKVILDKDPSLLYEQLGENEFVTSLSGHKFNLKPYQVPFAVGDSQMGALVKSYFVERKDEKEADRQFNEQFPNGWEQAYKQAEEKEWKPIFEQRDRLLRAIRDSKKGDITSSGEPDYITTVREGSLVEKELHAFWELLDATRDKIITAGQIAFPPNLLLKPLQMYADDKDYTEYFGGRWDDPRALLFVQKVVGYEGIQGIMPVNYVQAHQDWLDVTAEKLQNDQPQERGTRFYRGGEGVDFYPPRARGTAGFNFMIYGRSCWCVAEPRSDGWTGAFRSLCQSKTAGLQNLCHRPETVDLSQQNRL